MRPLPTSLLCAVLIPAAAHAQPAAPSYGIRAHYTKYEHRIPMRDGARLHTAVYVPKDDSQTYPFLIVRTPYSASPYGVDRYPTRLGPSEPFAREGFIFVTQDVRGRYQSEGEWVEMRPHLAAKRSPKDVDESSDTYDTVEWLLKNVPRNNGRAGIWGISYPGFYAAAALPGAHPALKAASPQAPIADLYRGDDAYHNGAFLLAHNFGFYTAFVERKGGPAPPSAARVPFSYGTPDGYDFYLRTGPLANFNEKHLKFQNPYWNATLAHPNYDEFWQSRSLLPHLKGIATAVLTVGGWFDAEDLAGPLGVFREIDKGGAKAPNHLVMGPWTHGGWSRDGRRVGNLDFAASTGDYFRDQILLPFFTFHLKDRKAPQLAKAQTFVTGLNEWRRHAEWPPSQAQKRTLYFAPSARLSFDRPGQAAFDEYVSDPAKPVPHVGYTAQGMRGDYMSEDQRFAAARPDVLVYETEPLDADLTIAGPVGVTLHVSTSGTDSDFIVKLIDVYPGDFPDPVSEAATPAPAPANAVKMGGYQQLVRGEPFRGRFRVSFEKPEPFVPNQPTVIRFDMPDAHHTFRQGHRVMVQVQSTWFPHIDRNPQTFVDIPTAKASDFRKATQRVYTGGERASGLTLLVDQTWR
ncbi:MAG TPA: X-Pro dipeptidyl-peptidase [Solibacterales bacterium]|nr:X-Pro dipeptidyl-peptidase [Bryobacterales bacterium]